jgi:hypothetical protein
MNARLAALLIAIGLPTHTAAQESLAAEAVCGYRPHTIVQLLDRNWYLYLPYPEVDPFMEVKFDSGFRVRRNQRYGPCSTLIIAIGAGTIRWGDVTIRVTGNELTVNGMRVAFLEGTTYPQHSSVIIDSEGRVNENGAILTVQ